MRVAICDDEQTVLQSLRMLLEQRTQINTICSFYSPEILQDAIEEGEYFDVVFMDIEWNRPLNGIDFASVLGEISPGTQIIYVTGYNDRFSQQIFLKSANLCGYLIKPIDPILLDATLKKAWGAIQKWDEQKLLIQQKGIVHAIASCEIYYLESQGHHLTVHTTCDSILCYERLEELKERLPSQFFQCHKSYLVNMDCIRRIERKRIILKTGEELPISKAKYAETRAAYFRYMGETL